MSENENDDELYKIKECDHVVLKRGEIYKAVQVLPKKKVIFERQWIFLDNVVGCFYGTTFEIQSGGTLHPQDDKEPDTPPGSLVSSDAKAAGTDNRNIVDDGKSQKLTKDDIEKLKDQGLKGQEIVQRLIDNSSSFSIKTEYAQDKYIKKKKKKYENNVTVLRPSCRLLAMMYYGREPGKICYLRYDTLAQMLTLGNIHANSKILVFETCAGLVLGSVMERMGGYGTVIQMYPGGGPVRAGMESFGFPPHFHNTLHEFPICHLNSLLAGTLDCVAKASPADEKLLNIAAVGEEGSVPEAEQQDDTLEEQSIDTANSDAGGQDHEEREKEKRKEAKAQEKKMKMEEKQKRLAAAAAQLEGRNADGLVIASRFHPCSVLMGLLKFLSPSRPFVVYSQYLEPLVECFTKLKEQGSAVNIQITDTWLRHYQVLPNRTHPRLLMSGGGGYLLSGTTVAVDSSKPAGSSEGEEPALKRQKLEDTK